MDRRVIRHGVTDSTSERAFAALAEGSASHGDVHLASAQTAGRGRLGREWSSPEGGDLYASVVLLPPPPGYDPVGLTMAVGLGVLRGLERLGGAELALKWPNDVVDDDGAKLAGVLVESRGLQPNAPHYVAGFGVNVTRTEFPAELERERPVTSLALCGVEADAERALTEILSELEASLSQLADSPHILCSAFVERAGLYGGELEVQRGSETSRGRLLGLDLDAGLCLATQAGEELTIPLEHVSALRHI
ncbi:MAG: biotin--[acetyl-CoA-carboxylase] ligase [Planctomycetes bacterium]|nr:biotin--[acetyl-CoA-carboxylase] ligase [Planctomycetota bacterium]